MGDVELKVPSDVAYVSLARLVVTVAARQSGMDDERVQDLKIAVSEATTNAILAHQRIGREGPVVLRFGRNGGQFRVTIHDTGPGFDPAAAEPRPPSALLSEGGLGVVLIRGLADDVEFVRGGGMSVDMRFTIDLRAEQAS